MKKHIIREIKLNIESEFALNLITYFTQEEGYVFVGNENEIWLENLSHQDVQLIYLNAGKTLTPAHATYITHKADIISKQIKRKFLMRKIKAVIINTCDYEEGVANGVNDFMPIIHISNAADVHTHEQLTALFPAITQFDLNTSMAEMVMRLKEETKKQATHQIRSARLKITPIVTYVYVGILFLIFGYLWLRQQQLPPLFVAIHYGSLYNPLIVGGEYWRLLSAAFMHLQLMHFLFNSVFIFRFGMFIENTFGKWRMILIILISAIMGSLFSFAFSPTNSLGASGVAYGFIGASIFLGFEMRKTFMPFLKQVIFPMLIVSTMFSMFMTNIDHFGHLGGFIGGFLAAAIVGLPNIKPFMMRTVVTIMTLIILSTGLWINGVRLTESHHFGPLNRGLIIEYFNMGRVDRAIRLQEIFFNEVE